MADLPDAFVHHPLIRGIRRVEDGLLVLLTSVMVIFAGMQIVLRNVFGAGIIWVEPMLQVLVLWLGMLGAMVATRHDKHINVNVFFSRLPDRLQPWVQIGLYLFAASVSAIIAWHAGRFVSMEYAGGTTTFAQVPVWLCALILPVGFCLIAGRYCAYTLVSVVALVRNSRP